MYLSLDFVNCICNWAKNYTCLNRMSSEFKLEGPALPSNGFLTRMWIRVLNLQSNALCMSLVLESLFIRCRLFFYLILNIVFVEFNVA